jgi:hypothetical protein
MTKAHMAYGQGELISYQYIQSIMNMYADFILYNVDVKQQSINIYNMYVDFILYNFDIKHQCITILTYLLL